MNKALHPTELSAAQLERPGARILSDSIPRVLPVTKDKIPAVDVKPVESKDSVSTVASASSGPGSQVPWPDQISYHRMDSPHMALSPFPKDTSDQKPPALDADDDSEWELELDCTPQYCNAALDDSVHDSAADVDSDCVIDENGVGIIWHVGGERDECPAGDALNNAEDESDFLHVDIFPVEMYFRTMSLRATAAGYAGSYPKDEGGD